MRKISILKKILLALVFVLCGVLADSAIAAPDDKLVALIKEQLTKAHPSPPAEDPVNVWIRVLCKFSLGAEYYVVGIKAEIKPEVEISY
jgi:hypothetical protein